MTPTETQEKPAETPAEAVVTKPGPRPKTAADYKKLAVHEVTLPSGAVVEIKLPSLPQMVKSGTIPNDLVDQAIQHEKAEELTRDILKETWAYTCFIVPHVLVTPEVTSEDVDNLVVPAEDTEMLVNFAARRTDIDAVGHQLGGLETQKSFRELRGLTSLAEALGDV